MDNDRVRDLLARIERQDQAAFRELYKGFSRKVFAYVLNMVNDHGRAEEVLVDTMYEVWRNPSRFRGDSQFGTWLIGIARNKALMVYRSRRADEVHDDLDDIAETRPPTRPMAMPRSPPSSAARACSTAWASCRTSTASACTWCSSKACRWARSPRCRRCPEGTVKTRLFHARQKIKNCLSLLLRNEGGGQLGGVMS